MSISKSALRSTLFVAITSYLSEAVNFVTSIFLARLLLPEYFGVVALALFFNELFGRVREFGFDQALIHRQTELERARASHFILQVGSNVLSFLLVLAFSPVLRKFYPEAVVNTLLIFSLIYIVKAATATQRIVLEKELKFAATTIVDLFSLLIASVAAIWLAVHGYGLMSLVVYQSVNILISFIALWVLRPWRPCLKIDLEMIRWYLKFGWFLWLGGITTFVIYKFNDFVTGTFLSTGVLGFYSRAFTFAQRPTSSVTGVVSRVALPTYAKLQKEKEKLSFTFNLVLRNIVRVSAPLSLFLYLLAEDFTRILLGEKWLPMVPIFRILLIYGFLRSIFDDAGAFLTAIGKPNLVSRYLAVQALIILITTPALIYFYGVNGAAWSLNIVLAVGLILAYRYVKVFVKVDFRDIFIQAMAPAVFTAFAYLTVIGPNLAAGSLLSLVLKFSAVGLTYLFLMLLVEGKSLKQDLLFLFKMMKG
ncbi:MAG: lipopolysaccharide biosynthesis protein [Patescibacteria group bacterium]